MANKQALNVEEEATSLLCMIKKTIWHWPTMEAVCLGSDSPQLRAFQLVMEMQIVAGWFDSIVPVEKPEHEADFVCFGLIDVAGTLAFLNIGIYNVQLCVPLWHDKCKQTTVAGGLHFVPVQSTLLSSGTKTHWNVLLFQMLHFRYVCILIQELWSHLGHQCVADSLMQNAQYCAFFTLSSWMVLDSKWCVAEACLCCCELIVSCLQCEGF